MDGNPKEAEYVSTGEVARMCGVTRDAVVKWIRKGKLPAAQTPGGHYRVPREACEALSQARGGPPVSRPEPHPNPRAESTPEALRCWEYFGEDGHPQEVCRNCLVYLARAQKCYRLAELGEESGHRLHFCRHDCRTCAYYRACQGLATEVLVVTRDDALTHRLLMRADGSRVSMRFARSGYECSAVIATFSPALVVLDSDLLEVREGQLARSIREDDRIPGARVVVALRKEHQTRSVEDTDTVGAPITAEQIETLAEEAASALSGVPLDVA